MAGVSPDIIPHTGALLPFVLPQWVEGSPEPDDVPVRAVGEVVDGVVVDGDGVRPFDRNGHRSVFDCRGVVHRQCLLLRGRRAVPRAGLPLEVVEVQLVAVRRRANLPLVGGHRDGQLVKGVVPLNEAFNAALVVLRLLRLGVVGLRVIHHVLDEIVRNGKGDFPVASLGQGHAHILSILGPNGFDGVAAVVGHMGRRAVVLQHILRAGRALCEATVRHDLVPKFELDSLERLSHLLKFLLPLLDFLLVDRIAVLVDVVVIVYVARRFVGKVRGVGDDVGHDVLARPALRVLSAGQSIERLSSRPLAFRLVAAVLHHLLPLLF